MRIQTDMWKERIMKEWKNRVIFLVLVLPLGLGHMGCRFR